MGGGHRGEGAAGQGLGAAEHPRRDEYLQKVPEGMVFRVGGGGGGRHGK